MQPKISVIIPAYNEEKLIGKCLEALKRQTYPKEEFEIIVVDNGSKDTTAMVAKSYGARVYTYTDIQGCGASRQFGSTQAKGSIVAFTDADAEPFPNWLEKIEKILSQPKIVCVGGRAVPNKDKFFYKSIFVYFDIFHLSQGFLGKPLMGGYNMAIKKQAYDAVGGFDGTLLSCDDWDLALKLRKRFGKVSVVYDLGLVVRASVRKLESRDAFTKYFRDNSQNYASLILLGKKKARPTFTVR